MIEVIQKLKEDNSKFNCPNMAISCAEAINRLSSDIYTDEDRFIYELFQNADDANNTEELIISIGFIGNYMFFSHNGKEFSKSDLKSICSIGDGSKTNDENKIGYKGIGFKSVFAISNCVIIKSGSCCFKFDEGKKIFGDDNWDPDWKEEKMIWKKERNQDGKSEVIKMPWQIIPIHCDNLPDEINCNIFNGSNISTILQLSNDKLESLKKVIKKIFDDRILLFLKSENIKVNIQIDDEVLLAEKRLDKHIVHLKTNSYNSDFLIQKTSLNVPDELRCLISKDNLIPEKLKSAKKCELAFAIELSPDGSLKKLDSSNVYTYLPTSIELKLPFLLNSSFITDAGRQHIHKDNEWNKWLFKNIPKYYLLWVQELTSKKEYIDSILNIIPNKIFSNGNVLFDSFNNGYLESIKNIPFIPNKNNNKLLKISEAIYDETGLSEIMDDKVIEFINKKYKCEYNKESFISKSSETLSKLGIRKFDKEQLVEFICSSEHNTKENSNELLIFLFETFNILEKIEIKELKETAFIYSKKNNLQSAANLYLESEYKVIDRDIDYVDTDIYTESSILNWFNKLGINEISDDEYIKKTVLVDDNYYTTENIIEIGKILFDLYKDNKLDCSKNYKLLSTKGSIQNAREMYLSDFYNPILKLEKSLNEDIYISNRYTDGISDEDKHKKEEWSLFFRKIGVANDIEYTKIKLCKKDCNNRFDSELLHSVIKSEDKNPKYSNGYIYHVQNIGFQSFSLIEYVIDNYEFSKIFWNKIFRENKHCMELKSNIRTHGYNGWYEKYANSTTSEHNYFEWLIKNKNLFPTLDKGCKKASDIFINTKENIDIAAPYLPVLDYDNTVSDGWRKVLELKETFNLDELLHILELVWKTEDNKDNVKKRISKIYEKIIELGYVKSEREKIKNWGANNKLLTNDGKSYKDTNSLHLITVDGFISNDIVYFDASCNDIIELMRALGVKVINNVEAKIEDSDSEEFLNRKLLEIAPLISLLKNVDPQNIRQCISEIKDDINKISFYKTNNPIILSYDNDSTNKIERSWYYDEKENKFYYVGDISYAKIVGFIEPLSKILKIAERKDILSVILWDDYKNGKNFMSEKGYDISDIDKYEDEEEYTPNNTFNIKLSTNNYLVDENQNYITGYTGEYIVYKWLKGNGYTNVKALNMVNKENKLYDILIDGETYYFKDSGCHYDIECTDNSGAKILIEVKSTKYPENEIENMPISSKEWKLIGRGNLEEEKYLIFRVFNATSDNPQIYIINAEKIKD